MLIRLFDRELTQQEITAAAAALEIENLPLMDNPMEQPAENPAPVEKASVAALVSEIARAPHCLHVMYQLVSVSLPMLSVFMDKEQATVLSYHANGVRASRMLNPQRLKGLLLEAFSGLPMISSANDVFATVAGADNPPDLVRRLYAGETDGLEIDPEAGFNLDEMTSAIRENPCIRCVFTDGDSSTSLYGISDGSRLFSILPDDKIACGSARPVIDAVSRGWMERCRAQILAEMKND